MITIAVKMLLPAPKFALHVENRNSTPLITILVDLMNLLPTEICNFFFFLFLPKSASRIKTRPKVNISYRGIMKC